MSAQLEEALDAFERSEGRERAQAYVDVVEAAFERWPSIETTPQGRELDRRRRTILALEALRAAVRGARRLFACPGGSS